MRRHFVMSTVLAAAMAVGVAAQSGSQQPTSGQSGKNQNTRNQTVTLTGCVQAGDQAGATGTSGGGATGTPAGSSKNTRGNAHFILTNVSGMTGGASTAGTAGTGTAAPGTAASGAGSTAGNAGTTVMLSGSNLQKHVGHQVEVKGRWDNAGMNSSGGTGTGAGTSGTAGSAAGAGTGSGTGSAIGSSTGSGSGGTLHVTSVRMISSTCSGGR